MTDRELLEAAARAAPHSRRSRQRGPGKRDPNRWPDRDDAIQTSGL